MKPSTFTESTSPPVAVFDATWPPALAFTRALGRAGVPVHVYSHTPFPATRWSRYATRFERCPDPAHIDRFQEWLSRELRSGRIVLVAPTSDVIVYHLAVAEPRPSLLAGSIASPEQILSLVFKDRFEQACAEQGVARPRTLMPVGPDELAQARDLRYPLVLKPRSHVGLGGVRGRVVRTFEELRQVFRPYHLHPEAASALRRHPHLAWPLLQEYAADAHDGLYSIAGAFGTEGRLIGLTVSRKWAQWPPTLGIGTLFEGVDEPAVGERGAQVVERFLTTGLFELELARDPRSGKLLALDLNPRGYGQMALAIAGGLNLPLIWYRDALGERVGAADGSGTESLAWVHPFLFGIGRAMDPLRRGIARPPIPARALGKRRVRAGTDWRDPASSGAFLWWLARQSLGIARAHLAPDE